MVDKSEETFHLNRLGGRPFIWIRRLMTQLRKGGTDITAVSARLLSLIYHTLLYLASPLLYFIPTHIKMIGPITQVHSSPKAGHSSIPMKRYPPSGIDVLVVGGGIGGMFAAIECHRKGHNVRVLEAGNSYDENGIYH